MYDQDYISYSDKKEQRLCCMRCGKVLKERTNRTLYEKIDEYTYHPVQVEEYNQVADFKRVSFPVIMNGGQMGEAGAFLCIECSKEKLDHEALIKQIRRGWELEMRAHNYNEMKIQNYLQTVGDIKPAKDDVFVL